MGFFNKKNLLNIAGKLGDLSGTASRILLEKTVEAAKTTDQVIGRFGASFQQSMSDHRKTPTSSEPPQAPKIIEAQAIRPAETATPRKFCNGKGCMSDAVTVEGFCENHQRERDQHRARMCGTKMKFQTLDEARLHAADLSAKSGKAYTGYPCNYCEYFHFGTSKIGHSTDHWSTYDS
jgi:hypothetical protein